MSVVIREVTTPKEFKQFIKFKHSLYKGDKYAVLPLMIDDKLNLSKDKNPSLKFCEVSYFLAYKDNKVVGRVAAIINSVANETWNSKNARFGWFDFIDDAEVSKALLETVEKWAEEKGMDAVHGPLGFTDLDQEGMLIEGFDQKGTLPTIYNYPYYPQHLEKLGYQKDVDWLEYKFGIPDKLPERFHKLSDVMKKKYSLHPAKFKSRREIIKKYSKKVFDLMNICYKDLYGYTKLNDEQMKFYAKLYFSFIRLDTISVIVDEKDNVVAFGVSLPNLSNALQKAKGRIFPFGWFYLLKELYWKNDTIDWYLIAIHPDYQNKGVISIMYTELVMGYINSGYKYAQVCPELEHNERALAQWKLFDYLEEKRRRVYIKQLNGKKTEKVVVEKPEEVVIKNSKKLAVERVTNN